MKKWIRGWDWWLVGIMAIGLLIRLYRITEVPPGMLHDELEYVNNGYALFQTGRDLYGDSWPLTIGGVGYVAVPAYLIGLMTWLFGLGVWQVRFLSVVMGVVGIGLVYGITKCLFRSLAVARWVAVVFAVSMWSVKMSRLMYDPPTALFFYLLGIYWLVHARSGWRWWAGWVSLGMGLISYYGAIFIYPLVVLWLVWYRWKDVWRNKEQILGAGIICLVFVGILFQMVLGRTGHNRTTDRATELIFLDEQKMVDEVVYDRWHSEGSEWLDRLVFNKLTYVLGEFWDQYLGAFSLQMMFVNGDPNRFFGLWQRGELSVIELPLLILGLVAAWRLNRRAAVFLIGLVLIGPVTAGISTPVYGTRAFLMWPFLLVFIGIGLWHVVEWLRKQDQWLRWGGWMSLGTVYGYLVLSSLYIYYFSYPVYAREIWFDSEKQVAEYLMVNQDKEIVIYAEEARQLFMEYTFYAVLDPRIAQAALDKNDILGEIEVQGITFKPGCPAEIVDEEADVLIVDADCNFVVESDQEILARDRSERVMWKIYK